MQVRPALPAGKRDILDDSLVHRYADGDFQQARGTMSASASQPAIVPRMPTEWTHETVRALSPARLGRRIRLELFMVGRAGTPGLGLTVKDHYERFGSSAADWVAGWNRIAELVEPQEYQKALAAWSERVRWIGGGQADRDAVATAALDAQMPKVLSALAFAGSHGQGELLTSGARVDLRQAPSEIVLTSPADGATLLTVAAARIIGAEAAAPSQTGGLFVSTVGHGLAGDLLQQRTAQFLNDRFSDKRVRSVIRIQATSCELFLTSSQLQEKTQVALSAVRALAESRPAVQARPATGLLTGLSAEPGPVTSAAPVPDDADLVTKLERLARLRDSGALTQFEFQSAKDKLLR